jgi:hypothetical protein
MNPAGCNLPKRGILGETFVLEYCSVPGRLNKRSATMRLFEATWKKATSLALKPEK